MEPTTHLYTASDVHMRRVFPNGEFLLLRIPNFQDPCDEGLYVGCVRHKKTMKLESTSTSCVEDLILKAAKECPECIAEEAAKIPPTKWPEGSEL